MNSTRVFLYTGIGFSIFLHGIVFSSFIYMGNNVDTKKHYKPSVLVPVQIKAKVVVKPLVEKVKLPKKKKRPVEITKATKVNPAPVSHKRTVDKKVTKPEEIKQVFGVTKKTVEKISAVKTGIGVRVGNTLMKEQEKEYTPPEEVKDYITIPVFDLTILPSFKIRATPKFPESLKEMEIEGEVYLSASIDDEGVVVEVRVVKSDHDFFSKAAVKALLASRFIPASKNGEPVGTILDDLVYKFILDE